MDLIKSGKKGAKLGDSNFLACVILQILLLFSAEEQQTLAFGLQSAAVIFQGLGTIPGPILFGIIFDSACIYW